ncbi:glycoside hydrolase superfamily [Mycena rosella]|uniref:chitinase n=1 Tax=Mycena rosella TaxID=1033263 RepID=A0AAD7M9M1_MYCRO|nr:glycoside hydrolase superfamily [Mycena rosella]
MIFSSGVLSVLAESIVSVVGYDPTRSDNLVTYYGQNSYGATHSSDTANWQKNISTYCQDTIINAIPIAFVDVFFSTGGLPDLNMANTCNPTDDAVFPGTGLANCQFLAAGIEGCQAAGKIVTISIGGASGAAVFSSNAQGVAFADTIWNLFLGGSSTTRPFGAAVLDGVDLDIEGGSSTGFAAFVTQIRSHTNGASKPQVLRLAHSGILICPFPDAWLGSVINAVAFDAIYVQFYNNFWKASVANFNNPNAWNFDQWDTWAKTVSPNPNVKIFIGAPAASSISGYVDAATLGAIALSTRAQDVSQAYANGRYDIAVKNIIAGGSSGTTTTQTTTATKTTTTTTKTTTTPPTTAPPTTTKTTTTPTTSTPKTTTTITSGSCAGVAAWVSTIAYVGGSQVTFNAHLWQANWWSEADSPGGASGDWADLGACASLGVATAKVAAISKTAAAAGKLTGTAIAASREVVETGKASLEGRDNSRVFRL